MCCAEKKVTPRPVPVVKIAANVKNKNLIQEYTAEIDVKIKIISKVACCRIKSLARKMTYNRLQYEDTISFQQIARAANEG